VADALPGAVEAVLLDLDGTLITTADAMRVGGRAAFRAVWPELDDKRAAAAGERFRRDPEAWFGRYAAGDVDFVTMRRERLGEVVRWLGLQWDPARYESFEAAYEPAFTGALRVFDDVLPGVERWRAAGLPVGILTNSSRTYTTAKLGASGLASVSEVVVTTDDHGIGKPDPRVFHHACGELGSTPEHTAYVGDELAADAIGSRDAGLVSHWLLRSGELPDGAPVPADVRLVTSLDEVLAGAPEEVGAADLGTRRGDR
jgi:putative hydrolase of the HAD superfamily